MPEDTTTSTDQTQDEASKKPEIKVDTGDADHMHVKVYAPFKVYFDGIATSISAVNETGPFDILPRHHNFMTLINQGEVIVRTDQAEEKFKIMRGIMHVKADDVVVFLDV
jgi:F0F1-type ATP synthase epsilon subunit